jgi:hypothetical protein
VPTRQAQVWELRSALDRTTDEVRVRALRRVAVRLLVPDADMIALPELGPNIGLLDARGTGQILHTLSYKFRAIEFADFCTIAEEIVLRDSILLIGKFDKLPRPLRGFLQPLVNEGVFTVHRTPFSVPHLPEDRVRLEVTARAVNSGLTDATSTDASFEARRLLGAEASTGFVATPLLRQLQHFGLVQRPRFEHTVWDLASQYRKLSNAALDFRRRYNQFSGVPSIRIPPIALLAIQRSANYEDIIPEVLQLRDEFAELRASLREVQERLLSGRLSPAQAIELEQNWRSEWERVSEGFGANQSLALGRTSLRLLQDGVKLVTAAAKFEYAGLADVALNWIRPTLAQIGAMQMRPVHRPIFNYLQTADYDMKQAVARLFQYDFVRLEREMLSIANPESPWRLALDPTPVSPPSFRTA